MRIPVSAYPFLRRDRQSDVPIRYLSGSQIMLDEKTKELIAVGAAITANCQPCLEYHAAKARERGVTQAEILAAIAVGKEVRRGAAGKMDRFAGELVGGEVQAAGTADCGCR
jgi:AhpD family alkylhydroperoxidase